MIYMYLRGPGSGSPYLFTNNTASVYGSDKNYIKALQNLLLDDTWDVARENENDRHELIATFETPNEFKQLFPELCI